MVVINHFGHEEHPLELIENWETVAGAGDNDDDKDNEKKGVVQCDRCQEPISIMSGDSAYGCVPCRYFLHKTCSEPMRTINRHFHLHPLTLHSQDYLYLCDVCNQLRPVGFSYSCLMCDFDACLKCGAAIGFKEKLSIKFKHEGHPQHVLTLQSRSATISCDACHTEEKDLFYQCDSCDFWIHKSCTSLASTINLPHHHHPLVLIYSLLDNFHNFEYFCGFCDKLLIGNDWLYHCANCRYFAHIKCALNAQHPSIPRDGPGTSSVDEGQVNDLLQFPMPYAFTDPLKLLHSQKITQDEDDETTAEINHWSHDHPLIPSNVDSEGNNIDSGADADADPVEVCYGCLRPLSFPYYSCTKDGCPFFLHKYCAELSLTLDKHQLHPDHPLHLVNVTVAFQRCDGCRKWGNTFMYRCETCHFALDVNCAFLPNNIKHELHKHPLIQVINRPKSRCGACDDVWFLGIMYVCKACNFQLDIYCALRSPSSLGHRYCKGHDILLTYKPVEDHPEDFYCDICELEMHPKRPLYYCQKCKNSFHLRCLSGIDYHENALREGTIVVSYHKHPLTFVRRKKSSQYVCSKCNVDINGRLILECRSKTCNFNICILCHDRRYYPSSIINKMFTLL